MRTTHLLRRCTTCALAVAIFSAGLPAHAGRGPSSVSELSVLSLLPVAMSVTSASLVLAGTASVAVVAVEATAEGVVWIVERASDGARGTLRFARDFSGGLAIAAGEAISVVAMGTGWLLCSAGKVVAFVPNEIGASLLYSERITR
jgi:hypothetical protein